MPRFSALSFAVLVGLALASLVLPAAAGDLRGLPPLPEPPTIPEIPTLGNGWYLRGDVGYSKSNDPTFSVSRDGVRDDYLSSRLGNAATVGVGIGYRPMSWLRVDATLDYRSPADFRGVYSSDHDAAIGTEDTRLKLGAITGLVNAYVDLGTWSGLTPYLGAGAGFSSLRLGNYAGTYHITPAYVAKHGSNPCGAAFSCASPSNFPSRARMNFAWALMAGTAIELGGGLSIDVGYRYLNLGRAETRVDPNVLAGTGSRQKLRSETVDAHEVRVGLRWAIGGPEAREADPPRLN